MADDRQTPRRRRRPQAAPVSEEPVRIIVGTEEDTPDWMVSDTSGAASRRNKQKKTEPEAPRHTSRGAQETQAILQMKQTRDERAADAAKKPAAPRKAPARKKKASARPMSKKARERRARKLRRLTIGALCGVIAVVLLTFRRYDSIEVNTVAMYQGMVVLPFVFLTSLVLLFAILILADHERLEQANRLAGLREVYYQGLRQQETQVRRLRHDLRNHLTAVRGFLEQGDEQGAIGYLDQIAGSPALRGTRRLCENEAANAVLTAKAEAMEREGVAADFAVSLPRDLPVADMDLCALLGNALDNAIEGSRGAGERRITIRCKADKGLFMLRVENTLGGAVQPDLATTKTDKAAHGFGIPGMREIAERYGGTLDAGVRDNGFELVVCLPLAGQAETL